jgi:type I restriction enzyme R subunit
MELFFEKGKFTEEELEYSYIELFKKMGYEYVSGESIHRRFKDVLLYDDLTKYLRSKYYDITDNEIKGAISVLDNIPSVPLYDGNREAYRMISEGFDLVRDDISKIALHIDYIDFDNKDNNKNIYKVINQYMVEDLHIRKPDLLVFINGIPVAIFEFKTAIEEDKTISDAWKQIHTRFSRDIPGLLKYNALSIISDGANTKIGTIFTPYKFYYAWNKINEQDSVANGISSLYTLMQGVFSKDRLLSILRDFIFFPDDSKK